ncbi:MAG: aminopeptidase N [Planktotalea sp.]|jgi:aminopeptidase N|uniref:aminopeptidase N n=1 Tax=Planktotalea sp. TaxID=2029877 RepID=UPI000EBF3CD7|nr:aminopeptidase N [Planktotalea sp.]MBT5822876.1 aminopeptidase N [Paracoccaceae bacterium]MDG1077248.1 aminopeptidase N [Planktotalea sp.]HCW84567.1 aminopeptidase N [Paracoccaceae bacterium]
MREPAPQTIYLKDYTAFGYTVEDVHLTFKLSPTATRVLSRIRFAPNPKATDKTFFLHGEQLDLKWAKINGADIAPNLTPEGLTADVPDGPFTFEAEVEISPQTNTALEGLYMSRGMYCTQCEAEGFRKITYYPDRPDVMTTFTVRVEGPHPVLLSNGNPTSSGTHFAEWHDPWPKPAYLFALVAGELIAHPDRFTTMSGKDVELNIYVRAGDEDKCAFGMEALKKSMIWDEKVYGREYDLDIFNIVAVDDFNMGAMENKGLNVFNSSCVLASPETSTDANFERIEAIIAHEYFHNWTGNRITCRDWFQLCLKEGLTVYRDSQFTSDIRSASVKRISDVIDLRGRQFAEDGGPLAHPVRPDSFMEINNFYTATVYEKGAEVIGMLKTLVGDDAYAMAVDLYFERHDGDAATIEDWLQVFEDVTGRNLKRFKRWYTSAGTPRLRVKESYKNGRYKLTFRQETLPTPGQPQKKPRVIPIAVGLLNAKGDEIAPTQILEMTKRQQSFKWEGLNEQPTPSILRGFSAPVILERETNDTERAFLLAHDTDPFNRWEAGRELAKSTLLAMIEDGAAPNAGYLDGMLAVLRDDSLDPATRALMLGLPSQSDLTQILADKGVNPDPQEIYDAVQTLKLSMAQHMQDTLPRIYAACQVTGPYSPETEPAGKRALANAVLALGSRLDGGKAAQEQYDAADNMTQQLSALACLLQENVGETALAKFYEQWKHDRLVMDKWFNLQVSCTAPEDTATTAETLTSHADFDHKNPNRFRATLGALAMRHAGFHHISGRGYTLLADWLITLDPINPQTTARMCSAFQTWKRYDEARQNMMLAEIDRILSQPNLSRDTTEMLTRIRTA